MHATVDIRNNSVVIIGPPASGKTYLSKLLAKDNPGHELVHTDNYIRYGYEESLYQLLNHIKQTARPLIIEGILGYRLLRKGVELNCYYPEMVIELEISEALMLHTYRKERGASKNISAVRAMVKANATVLTKYKAMPNPSPPQWIKLKNQY